MPHTDENSPLTGEDADNQTPVNRVDLDYTAEEISSFEANDRITVVSCTSCKDGVGEVQVYDTVTMLKIGSFEGLESIGRRIGHEVLLQTDSGRDSERIWYTSEDSLYAAEVEWVLGRDDVITPTLSDWIFEIEKPPTPLNNFI